MIRRATAQDIPRIVDMARRFHDGQPYEFNAENASAFIASAIQSGCVLVGEASFLIGMLVPDPANFARLTAYEAFWWSEGREGRRIREAFEEWGRAMGAVEVQFSHPWEAQSVGRMLERAGYAPATKVWRKVV